MIHLDLAKFLEYWRSLGKMAGEGNSLFLNRGDGENLKFDEARESCTNRAGWGWGVCLADLDNDTDLDIYAANGWITGKKSRRPLTTIP